MQKNLRFGVMGAECTLNSIQEQEPCMDVQF